MTQTKKIVLVGQPNVGKSVLFGCLTNKYATVSNYPGTTVEISRTTVNMGKHRVEIIDTPGLYSIFPITEEERVTLNILKNERPDLIVHVIDAKNMRRMLTLTLQMAILGIPLVVVLNMYDELAPLGISINIDKLSKLIRLPAIATVGITRQGIGQLTKEIGAALEDQSEQASPAKEVVLPEFSEGRIREWFGQAEEIWQKTAKKNVAKKGLSTLDKIVISPWTGIPILAAVLYLGLYKFVGSFGAGTVVDFLEGGFENYLNPMFVSLFERIFPWPHVVELFAGEYGILTLGIRYAVAIILPIVGMFFLVFAVIEDSGYLPRLSFLLDRLFKKIGLSGKAVIPMVLGLGCDTMATMVTRTLPTRRERLIATLLLSLCIPCSAQLGVILGLLGKTPSVLIAWFVIIVAIFIASGTVLSKIIPGRKPVFVMEVPPMRVPQLKNVLMKTAARMKWYFMEIVPLFIIASILIWAGKITGAFDWLTNLMSHPLKLLGLPIESASVFIFGFFRRDYGAAGLYDLHSAGAFTNNQLLIAVVVLTLFLPCITQFLITIKERGWKMGVGISALVLAVAFIAGFILNNLLLLTGINF